MLSLDELYYDQMQKVVLRALQEEQFEFATFSKNEMCCFTRVRSTFTRVQCANVRKAWATEYLQNGLDEKVA